MSKLGQRSRQRIVVLGAGRAGYTAAIALKDLVGDRHDVTTISTNHRVVDARSLVSLSFGLRAKEDISFDVSHSFAARGVRFLHAEVDRISLDNRSVVTKQGNEGYDYLLIATGATPNHAAIPGLGPRGYTQSIVTLAEAEKARMTFDRFLDKPGPVVVGALPGATRVGDDCEFLITLAHQLKQRRIAQRAPLTYLTSAEAPAPSIKRSQGSAIRDGLFGQLGIRTITHAGLERVEPDALHLSDGRTLPFSYAMVLPPMLGAGMVRACQPLSDSGGFVRVNELLQTPTHPEIFAAGSAVAMDRSAVGSWSEDAPMMLELSQRMAAVAARNLVARIEGELLVPLHDAYAPGLQVS